VAPPWGGAYFWDETQRDAVREGLFTALGKALGISLATCRQFRDQRFFLTPAVKCPSVKGDNDHEPSKSAVKNCSRFLESELAAAAPERILALGRVPFEALCHIFSLEAPTNVADFRKQTWWVRVARKVVPMCGRFFPGNNRHRRFESIIQDVGRLLELAPRNADVSQAVSLDARPRSRQSLGPAQVNGSVR
jgi:uracil-DNA glycosylase family 4